MSKIPEGWAEAFIKTVEALDAHQATYSTSFIMGSEDFEDYKVRTDAWMAEYERLREEQNKVAAIAAEATGKTVDETVCGALAGLLLAKLEKMGVRPSGTDRRDRAALDEIKEKNK